jgi:sugar/nucleoside kinase (ribokinase family)
VQPPTRDIDLLVVGDANVDLVLTGDVVPRFAQAEQLLDSADVVVAGSAGIMVAGAARLGLRTALAAHVGCDAFGDLMVSQLAARGVDATWIHRHEHTPTGISVILSRPDDRSILTYPGAIALLTPDDVPESLLTRCRHVHLASWFLIPSLMHGGAGLLARARAAGCSTSLDTNWDPSGTWSGVVPALAHVDVLLPNRVELLALAGASGGGAVDAQADDAALDSAAARLRRRGPVIAMKAGADGAIGWDASGRHTAAGLAVTVADTIGAGDSFDAAFLAGRLAGRPFGECLRWAAVGGSLSTRAAGGTAAQPDAVELAGLV